MNDALSFIYGTGCGGGESSHGGKLTQGDCTKQANVLASIMLMTLGKTALMMGRWVESNRRVGFDDGEFGVERMRIFGLPGMETWSSC